MQLVIKGFIETSFLDWDGKVVSTLYVPGCNFCCPFCHNSGLIVNPQQYATIPLQQVEKFLIERFDFIDGICLTGGEPSLHKDKGLFEFLRKIKDLGFAAKLDTNGSDPDCLAALIKQGLVDYIALDFKGPLDKRYDRLSGIKTDLAKIEQSLKCIMQSGVHYEFRTTVVPSLLEAPDVAAIAAAIAGAEKFVLQQFVPQHCWDEKLRAVKPYEKTQLVKMQRSAQRHVPQTFLRGV